jgi:imidazole glycerol-phosphate synthase subunit HisH
VKVGIVNYGMGNLGSVQRALDDLGVENFVAAHPQALFEADRVILPGVGAFGQGMQRLKERGWVDTLHRLAREEHRPLLGICLGMQMLATEGHEGGKTPGLGLIDGEIRHLETLGCTLRIPHVGWNETRHTGADPLFEHIPQAADFYFVHSYAFAPRRDDDVLARTEYGVPVVAAVRHGNVFGTQFHPEKSSRAGLQLLRNFLSVSGAC